MLKLGGEQSAGKPASENQGIGLSQASMKAMMSADSSIKQAQIQGNAATRFEGRAGVLKAEIKQGGGGVEAKEAELAEVEQKAMSATASQMNTLAEANQTIEEAAKAEQSSVNKTDASDTKTEKVTGCLWTLKGFGKSGKKQKNRKRRRRKKFLFRFRPTIRSCL